MSRTTDWTPDRIGELSGTRAVVTGANSGIGLHTARELARHGAEVTLAVRTPAKGEAAADELRADLSGRDGAGEVRVAALDLGSLESVEKFAADWQGPLDLLVNNAGVMTPPRYQQTSDGFELQFGTNHLGHFALTGRLLGALRGAAAPRVVTVSSIAHHGGRPDVCEGNPRAGYNASRAYSNSKLANLLFAAELQRRADAAGGPAHLGRRPPGRLRDEPGHQRAGPRLDPGRPDRRAVLPQARLPVGARRGAPGAVRRHASPTRRPTPGPRGSGRAAGVTPARRGCSRWPATRTSRRGSGRSART